MKKTVYIILYFLFVAANSYGQNEFMVNSLMDSTQRDPQIARDSAGNYVVIWMSKEQVESNSKGDIFLQRFNLANEKVGGEVLVNTETTGDQEKPALSMNSDGVFIAVWASYSNNDSLYDIKARIFHDSGPIGDEFLVNSVTGFSQTNPDVSINKNGECVVAWDSWHQDGSDRGVFGQRFDEDGNPLGSNFQVNTTFAYSQAKPAVKYLADGRFVVIWESWKQDQSEPSGYGIYGQLFMDEAIKDGNEFRVNTYLNNYQWYSDIEVFDDTTFVVTWCSWEQDGDDGGIYLQRFGKNAETLGGEFQVNMNTAKYQWLSRVIKLQEKNFAVIWSSWKQDGSREGVYARFFDLVNDRVSLEVPVNTYKESYQWEPDAIMSAEDELLVVWSSWGEHGKDYEIMAGHVSAMYTQAVINPITYSHDVGRTSTEFLVHVVDSSSLTGDTYQLTFDLIATDSAYVSITNTNTNVVVVEDFLLFDNKGFLFLTPPFEGIQVQIFPEFQFAIDNVNSTFINPSGSNLEFIYTVSSIGTANLAPIDVALIWGETDTLLNGNYAVPLDTAMGLDGVIDIQLPFRGWNLTDGEQMDFLVVDEDYIVNNRWDPGERIVFFTPLDYRENSTDTHAMIQTTSPKEGLIMPSTGDTTALKTVRPISNEDVYTFQTVKENLLNIGIQHNHSPAKFNLFQNYPNPFNPSTTIEYYLPQRSRVELTVYNILGQKVVIIVNDIKTRGYHKVVLDGSGFASGVYVYVLKYQGKIMSKKMMLIK